MSRWFPSVPRRLPPEGPGKSHLNADGSTKHPYRDEASALGAAEAAWHRTHRALNVYLCWQEPEHWHLSSSTIDHSGRRTT